MPPSRPAQADGAPSTWLNDTRALTQGFLRFGLVGLLTTALTYGVFRLGLALQLHYLLASTLAWMCGMGLSYVCNRRFTFTVREQANLQEAGRFLSGGVLQYVVASLGYGLMIGVLHLNPSLAFVINVGVGCLVNFSYMRWIVFSPRFNRRVDATLPNCGERV